MLETMFKGYVEGALWSSSTYDQNGENGVSLDSAGYGMDDVHPDTLAKMREDVKAFWDEHWEILQDNPERAGIDFWLTRNRHGAGFWDGQWDHMGEGVGRKLSDAAKVYGSVDLYVGDDDKIYQS